VRDTAAAATRAGAADRRPCPVCRTHETRAVLVARDRLYQTTTARFDVVRCTGCGTLRLDPPPATDELPRYYPRAYWFSEDAGTGGWLAERYRRLVLRDHLRFVERALEAIPAPRVLDVGCGGGLFLARLRERTGAVVLGLDVSAAALGSARRVHHLPVVLGRLDAAPLAEGSLDAITMFHVLEHLYDPGAYLDAARRLLKPGGRLIVQVPNAESWQFHLFGAAWYGLDAPRHLVTFGAGQLRGLLERRGFAVVRRRDFCLRDNPTSLVSSVWPGLDPMVRRLRATSGSPMGTLVADAAYLLLTLAAVPGAWIEAAAGRGTTVMFEARPA
jgi:SAM-dependent methyltransferase